MSSTKTVISNRLVGFRRWIFRGRKIGVTICEDIWTEHYLARPYYDIEPVRALVEQGSELILNLSASPFNIGKPGVRREMVGSLARTYSLPICYCNAVGGNDQLIFDGNSIAIDRQGEIIAQLSAFREAEVVVDTDSKKTMPFETRETSADLYDAVSLGVRDYLRKCSFKSVVLGLSGGIDSAVVAAIAVNALGQENVVGVSMPSPYSSRGSIDDALALARNLGIKCLQIPIADAFECFKAQFKEVFAGLPDDTTEENMQSRLRGMILMSLSNKFGHLLLTTGNKSELAVGYCTIYGDMAGGLAAISDVPKTMIYELARWMNREREIIPASTIEKPPSAELKPDQKDQGHFATLRNSRRNSAAVCRRESERARYRHARFRRKNGALGAAPRRFERIQTRTGRARNQSDQSRFWSRTPHADRTKVCRLNGKRDRDSAAEAQAE